MYITTPAKFPPIDLQSMVIPNVRIPNAGSRRYSPPQREAIIEQVSTWLKAGIVEPVPPGTDSVINALLCVPKKGGQFRICIDPRPLNKATLVDQTAMPLLEDVLEHCDSRALGGSQRWTWHRDICNWLLNCRRGD